MIDPFEKIKRQILDNPYVVLKRLVISLGIFQLLLTVLLPSVYTVLKISYNKYGITAFPIGELTLLMQKIYGFPPANIEAYVGAVTPKVDFNMWPLFWTSLLKSFESIDILEFEILVLPLSFLLVLSKEVTYPFIRDFQNSW